MSAQLKGDPWLEPWLPSLRAAAAEHPVLELGCGTGRDTKVLVDAGCNVVGIDLSHMSIALAKVRVPRGSFYCQDLREPFPLAPCRVIVASLVLHYFRWKETVRLVECLRNALVPNGLLLCRLNSTNDLHFGAEGFARIEENYYLVDGQPKRFFSQASVTELFAAGWEVEHLEEKVVDRYSRPKWLWEVVARGV